MKKRITLVVLLLYPLASVIGQKTALHGKVIDALTKENLPHVSVSIENTKLRVITDDSGIFDFQGLSFPLGEQILSFQKPGYASKHFPVTINEGKILELDWITLEADLLEQNQQSSVINLSDAELNGDENNSTTISGLLGASKDVFLRAAAYDFSPTFFRPRGFGSENSKVLINGIEMNKLYNGRPQWSDWGGLNDSQRNQVFTRGLSANTSTFSDLAGTSNITMRASQYRKGGKISYALANRSYRGRVMASYNSGILKNKWAYSFLFSRRYGEEGFRNGTLYDANSVFISAEKKLGEDHSLNFTAFYTPNHRGKSSANTQEVYDLKGVRYNAYWGKQNGEIRNSRVRNIKEPLFMLNHYWDISAKTQLNTNVAYQFGEIGNSRLGYDNAPNPDPAYYRKLPSYPLANPTGPEKAKAYDNLDRFLNDGQINWPNVYETNKNYGGPSRYYLYEDRNDDRQLSVNTILNTSLSKHLNLQGSLKYRSLVSENFASMIDLLGGENYLDLDTFNENDAAQSDLQHPNRLVSEKNKFKYNYQLKAQVSKGFVQAQWTLPKFDLYAAAKLGFTTYQRNGRYQNGSYPQNSLGKSKRLQFFNYGIKAGGNYKFNGKHVIKLNTAYFTKSPTLRNSFSNARQNNNTVNGLKEEKIEQVSLAYSYQTPFIKARLATYYARLKDATNIMFFYADGISYSDGEKSLSTAFIQEVLTGSEQLHIGAELGFEVQATSTLKLKGVASFGQYTYSNNPNLYVTSDDFEKKLDLGKAYLKNYKIAGGPQQAYQLGFEYQDPDYWWLGATANFFSHGYISISPITRTQNLYRQSDDAPFNDYKETTARKLLEQEKFGDYLLVNLIAGKSWKIKKYYLGFFVSLGNILNTKHKTGGYEQGRSANYRTLLEDTKNKTPIFGPKYWYGYGTTYYANVYVRF